MAQTISAASEALKINYQMPMIEDINTSHPLLTMLNRDLSKKRFSGSNAIYSRRTGINQGRGGRAEGGTLPTAGQVEYGNLTYNVKYLYVRGQITGPAIEMSGRDEGAFVSLLDDEMTYARESAKDMLHRQVWHDGSGLLTATGATSNSTTVVVKSAKFLEPGMIVDVIDLTDGGAPGAAGAATSRTIESVDKANNTFVISGAAITTDDNADGVFLSGTWSGTTARVTHDIWGLEALISNQNPGGGVSSDAPVAAAGDNDSFGTANVTYVGGVNRLTDSSWQANVVAGGALDATLDKFQEAYDTADIERGVEPGLIVTSHAVRRYVGAALTPLRQYGDEIELKGGWKTIKFANAGIWVDRYASHTHNPGSFATCYFISPKSLEWQVAKEWSFMDKDGAVLSRVQNQDAYEFTWHSYQQLCLKQAKANVRLYNLSAPA